MDKRNGTIDFLKFVFAVIVVVIHFNGYAGKAFFDGGASTVSFFLLVSGCMMVGSYEKRRIVGPIDGKGEIGQDTLSFMKHKITGILPNAYVAWIIAFTVMHINCTSFISVIKDLEGSIWDLLFISYSGINIYSAQSVTWYLSAMLLSMFVIYPLLYKFKDTFFYLIAPMIFIFSRGILYQNFGSAGGGDKWNGWTYGFVIRAFSEICAGCVCYKVAARIRGIHFTNFARYMCTIMEWGIYLCIIALMYRHGSVEVGFLIVLLFMVAVTLTLSGMSYSEELFQRRVFQWLGEYSFSLYLGHHFWGVYLRNYEWTYEKAFGVYLTLSFATGLFIMYLSLIIRKVWKKYACQLRDLIVEKG